MFPAGPSSRPAEGGPGGGAGGRDRRRRASRRRRPSRRAIEMMAHNGSVIEVRKENGAWTVVPDSQYARRITLRHGDGGRRSGRRPRPAQDQRRPDRHQGVRHHQQLRRRQDALGHRADGRGELPRLFRRRARGRLRPSAENHKRYGVPGGWYAWWRSQDRFDIGKEPNEPNRYGWMVEYDPYDPNSLPIKRTALGRVQARGRDQHRQQGRPRGALLRRRRALRVPLSLRHERHLRPRQSRGQSRPARRRHAVGRQVRREQGDLAAAGLRRGPAHRRERLREPGGRA